MIKIIEKLERLKEYLRELNKVAVAFSGGVDSTFLLKIAHDVLGDNILALTAENIFVQQNEIEETKNFCEQNNIRQIIFKTDILKVESVKENPIDRCYFCKRELFKNFLRIARKNNFTQVIEGSNTDDMGDFRPGMKALAELKIESPLLIVGLNKSEIRELSRAMKLLTADKPSLACLASRFAYGEKLTEEKILSVESAEKYLREFKIKQLRVRVHGRLARIEISAEDFTKITENRAEITERFKSLGFDYVTLDLQGFRSGSMNIGIKK